MPDISIELPDFDALWNYGDPAGTESKFQAILSDLSPDTSVPYRIELMTQIARTQGLQRRFDEAHATLDSANALMMPDMKRAQIRYQLERGRVLNSSGSPEDAKIHFIKAWEAAQAAHEDALAVDAAHMVAIVVPTEDQTEWNEKALKLAESSPDPRARRWRGSLYNNIGWTYHEEERFAEALEIFQKALELRKEQGGAESIRIAEWSIGRALRSLGRTDEALAIQKAQFAALAEAGRTSPYVHEELGECLLQLGNEEEATPYLALAYDELVQDSWVVENETKRLERLKGLIGRE